jgi:hypothetical protein
MKSKMRSQTNELVQGMVEKLWDKYAVSSRELESERTKTLKELDGFLKGFRVSGRGNMRPIRIFISSVQQEFAQERAALREYLRSDPLFRRFYDVFLFEDVPAIDRRADEVYLQEVERCDIYVGLFGEEYGNEDEKGYSPTAIPGLLFCFHPSCLKLYRRSSLICHVMWRIEACNIIKCLRISM